MRWILAPILALSCLVASVATAEIGTPMGSRWSGPQIWFDPFTSADALGLFQDNAPWPNAARQTSVITLEPFFITATADADLLTIASYAAAHGMKLNLDLQSILKVPNVACGGIEGYSYTTDIDPILAKLVRLGVRLDWIHLDEPMWFGHYDTEPGACQLTVSDLASHVAAIVNDVLASYPEIKFVEIEPIPAVTDFPDWKQTLSSFRTGLLLKTGQKIQAIQTDMNWDDPGWEAAVTELHAFLHEQNMGLGVIYNGTSSDQSNADWVNHAVRNFETLEGRLGIVPEQAVFSTWVPFPSNNLPETSPTTMTWLINSYLRERSRLEVEFVGQGAQGKLTTWQGKPIANASINGHVPGVDFTRPLPVKMTQGTVPSNATQALVGFRLNTECGCQGLNDILIGTLHYREIQGGSNQYSWAFPGNPAVYGGVIVDSELVDGIRVTRVISAPGQGFTPNSNIFPVTAGAVFQFSVPAATIGGAGWYGNVIIIWIDVNGNGISRVFVVPDAGKVTSSSTTTAFDGTFNLPKIPRVGPGSVPVSVQFDGTAAYRGSTWTPGP